MLRKLSTLLALALCLGMMAACTPSRNDTTIDTGNTIEASIHSTQSFVGNTNDTAPTLDNSNETLASNVDNNINDKGSYFIGKFQCAGDNYKDDYYLLNQESIPYIFFKKYGECVMGINYLEGGCDIPGKYVITDDKITVKLDFSSSILDETVADENNHFFITDTYIFTIIDENTISIDHMCYGVNPGDIFVRIVN